MIVVDTNILAYLFLPCEFTEAAERWFQREPQWVAPVLWRSEMRNILAGQVRRGLLSLDDACRIQGQAESLMSDGEFGLPSSDVLAFSHASACTAYDCEFVALAHQLGRPLLTLNKQVLKAFPEHAVSLLACPD